MNSKMRLIAALSNLDFNLALDKIWELINMANKYIEDTKPWNLVKENKIDELKVFIHLLVDVIRNVAETDFIPLCPRQLNLLKSN